MATIDALQTRIILDTNRDDLTGELAQALTDAIADSVEDYADELFWFNRKTGTANTVAATATVALPSGMRLAQKVTYLGCELPKVPLEAMEGRTETGPPSKWADDGNTVHIWPIPDAAYALSLFGIADLGVPTAGNSNAWTTEGYRLILACAKKILYRGSLRDPDGAALAANEEQEAISKLRRETKRRGVSELRTDVPRNRSTFNITRGW